MKKIILGMLAIFMIASCSEDTEVDQVKDPKMVDVTFNVKTFDVSDEPITRAATPAASVLERIEYMLLNTADDKSIKGQQIFAEAQSTFGKITLRIPEGNYKVFFWGVGKDGVDGNAKMTFTSVPFRYDNRIEASNKDIFYKHVEQQTINGQTSNVDMELARKTAKITIRINDKKPADVDHFEVLVMYQQYWFPFGSSQKGNITSHSPKVQIGSDGSIGEMYAYSFPDLQTKVRFLLFDADNKIIGDAEVNAPTYQNRNTIVRGNLFDLIGGKDFDVTVNDIWGEDNIIEMQ